MNACELITTIPNKNFWKFFNTRIGLMSPKDKMDFMDK